MRTLMTLYRNDEGRIEYTFETHDTGRLIERKTLSRPASIQVERLLMAMDYETRDRKPRDFARFVGALAKYVNGVH